MCVLVCVFTRACTCVCVSCVCVHACVHPYIAIVFTFTCVYIQHAMCVCVSVQVLQRLPVSVAALKQGNMGKLIKQLSKQEHPGYYHHTCIYKIYIHLSY